jgi:antitoxin component of MazEF toxin-antitoxin module
MAETEWIGRKLLSKKTRPLKYKWLFCSGGRGGMKTGLVGDYTSNYNWGQKDTPPLEGNLEMHSHLLPASTPAIRAKVVRVGNSVGVRLPASLHLALGTDVELTVRAVNVWPEGYFEMEPVGDDFVVPQRESAEAHEKRLKRLFGRKGSL